MRDVKEVSKGISIEHGFSGIVQIDLGRLGYQV